MDESLDLNDAFDSIVMAEDRFREAGYNEGFKEGKLSGEKESLKLGIQHGAKIGMELGFYSGFASTWMKLISEELIKNKESMSEKTVNAVKALNELIESFSLDDPLNLDNDKFNRIRSKFKQVCSLLNMTPNFGSSISF
jgi:hypothetical protein